MTFTDSTYAVDGAEITGRLYRLELASSTYKSSGIVEPTDLEVRELATPGTSVRILAGACVIAGDAVAFQGSYFGYNVGQESVPIASTGSGETRSDLIIVQAHDPTYAGSPFTEDPATDRLVYPEVVSDVSPTATTTSEPNAIVLARIDMPESTGTVTQDLITDLRRPLVLNPFFQDSIWHGSGVQQVPFQNETYIDFPDSTTHVDVPSWATRMDIVTRVSTARFNFNTTTGQDFLNFFGNLRHTINGSPPGAGNIGEYNFEWPGGVSRGILELGRTYSAVPYQGQNVELVLQANEQGHTGDSIMEVDNGTSVIWQVFFRQTPEFNL